MKRPKKIVQVATAVKTFKAVSMEKAIYGTGFQVPEGGGAPP